MRRPRDADAGADANLLTGQQDRLTDAVDDFHRQGGDVLGPAHAALKNHEFVAAKPRHDIILAGHRGEPAADLAQQFIAGAMSLCIIDLLEMIEVDEQYRE